MANRNYSNQSCLSLIVILFITISSSQVSAQLSVAFYANTCPSVYDTIRTATRAAISREARMGASLIRLFFHDCFVNGCDGSVLLDDTSDFVGEKNAQGNQGSIRGFEVIDSIKAQVDGACGSTVVSCADILAVAARDSVVEFGGPSYPIPVGRRDATTANPAGVNDLPVSVDNLDVLLTKFSRKGFSAQEMVALSGAHTLGQARCTTFRDRIYNNETNIDPAYATSLQATCPRNSPNGDGVLAPLDPESPTKFDENYFEGLINRRGLLHSDQVLFNGGQTDSFVTKYSYDGDAFETDFANAMMKMGNLRPLTGTQGEVRIDCKRIN